MRSTDRSRAGKRRSGCDCIVRAQSPTIAAFGEWNARFVASRETSELRAETLQMGASLASWARDLQLPIGESLRTVRELSFPAAFAACAAALDIDEQDGLAAHVWSWLENQVTAAMKAVPLGQVAGQRLLLAAHDALDDAVHTALRLRR